MNSATSTIKQILRHKISNGFVLFTAIWSSAIMPVMPSYAKMLTPDDLPTLGSDPVLTNDDKTEKLIAEYSQSAARFISDKKKAADLADMAQDFARSKVTNAATDEINRWLSKTGNAKFSVDVDKKLSIKNTQLDWLVPWYDSTDLLLFTQHNIHRTDGRLQTNNGIGVRRFTPKSMMGVNAFFDHDLSRYHSRLGFGAEYAQDFLKLSANTYLRASEWRSASELNNDYNARPANGWDLQAEGWLPSYPNIGGNLKFEQYFGDDVALFGKDKRQKDPLATTVGVNWTPFSLMTLSAEHKISGGLSETNAKLEFTWALGKSLAEQLDPTKVGDSRRLLGSRYDFVNRNNNIILEYQKKTLITLSLPAIIQGKTGDEIPLINALNTKYSLDKLTIHAPEFLMAGGEIILDGALTKIKLPSYKVAMTEQERKKNNLYRFTVTASDSKGNITPQASTFVEVTNSGVLSIKHNEVIKKGNFLANGQDINALTVTARDVLGNIAPDSTVTFTLPTELKLVTQKATSSSMAFKNLYKKMQAAKSTDKQKYKVITNIKGEASVQFTSLTTGEHRVQAVANGGVPIETAFFFIADTQQAHINHFNVLSDNAVADGKSKNKIQFHITDNHSHPIQGAMLQLDAINANATQLSPTDEQGNTDVEVTSQVAGPVKVTATLNEQNVTVETHFVFGQLAHVTILDLSQAEAGTDSNIKISLTDTHGNAVSGADGTVTVNIDGKPTPIIISETFPGSGVYTGKLPGQHSGTPNITVTVDGQTSPPETLIVEQPKTISPNNTDGTGQKGEKGVIDNIVTTPNKTHGLQSGDTLEVTVTITDTFGNGLSGLNTDNIDIGKHKGDTLTWTDNGDGSYTTTLPLTEVGNNDLTATINGTTSSKTDVLVNNASGTVHIDKVKIIKTEKPAAGIDSTITLELTDKHGNPVVGETEVTVNINDQPHTLPVTEISPGIYEAIIAGQLTGNHDISAIVNGKESPNELLIVEQPQPVKPQNPNGTGQKGEQGVVDKIEIKTGNTVGLQSGDKLEITVTVTDAFNNGLSGLNTNNIDIGKHKGDTLTWVDNGDGSYTTTLPLPEVGNNDLTVSINGTASPQKQIQVSNAAGKDKVSKVTIIKTEQPAAGSNSTLTVQLTDSNGNPVVGETEIIVNIDNNPHTLPAKEGKPGIYEITLPALQAGKHDIHTSVNNTVSIKESLLVEQPKPISPNNSNGTGQQGEKGVIDKVTIALDHTHRFESDNPLEITVTVTDAFGNGLAGLNTDNIDIGKHKGNTLNWVDNGDGSYTTTLTLTDVGSNDLTASVNGSHSPHTEVQVNNATGASHVDKVNIIKTEKPAAGTNSTVTIALTDKHGNPVVGATEITLNIDGQTHKRPAKEGNPGIYEVTLPALQAGNHNISASVNGKGSTDTTLVVTPPTPIKPNNTGKPGEKGVVNSITMTTGNTNNLQSGDQLEITVTVTDAFNNGLIGLNAITLNGVNGKPVWTDNRDGSYTATITLTEIGSKDLTASINSHKTPTTTIQVSNASGKNNVNNDKITKIETADAGSRSTLTVALTDKHANPVVGETNITIKIAGKEHILQTKEVTSGIYEITLPAQQQGHYEIIAVVNKFESQKKVLVVEKPKPIKAINLSGSGLQGERGVIDKIDMTLANTANLHSGDSLDVTVTLSDIFGNTLTGIDSSNLVLSGYKTDTLVWKDNGDGSYSTMLALTQTGAHDLIASISGKKTPKAQIQVHNATSSTKAANIIFDPISTSEAGETQTITLKITDANHHPVAEIANEIHLIIEGQKEVFQLTKSTKGPGIYTAILPGRLSGTYTVKASVNQKIESRIWYVSKASTITANPTGQPNERGSVDRIEFQTSPRHSLKVGDTLTLIATLKDAFGNTLKGMDTTLIDLPSGQNGNAPWKDNLDGTYHSDLILDTLGKDKLVAKANKKITSDEIIIDVANSEQVAHVTAVELEAIPSTSAGTEQTITVKAYGFGSRKYAITNIADAITVKIDSKDIPIRFTEHKNVKGTYTSTLPAMLSGKYTVEAKVGKQSASMSWVVNTTSTITVVPVGQAGTRGVVNNISLTTSTLSALKSGDILQLTVTAKDAFGNSLKGIDTSNITLTHTQKTKVTWKDNQNGSYTANLLLTQLASDTVKVSINGQSQDVNISVGNTSESTQIASVVLEPIYASEAGEAQTMTVKVTDQYQHPVTAIGDHISVKVNNQPKKIQFTDSVSNIGVYTATLPAEKMGDYTVEVSANKQVASRTWQVKKPAIITAKNNDGSGSENQRGVVKTVELSSSSTNDLKSGDSLQLTVTLKDAFGNYLEGINASHIQLKNKQANTISWSDNRNGRYTAVLPLTNIGENSLVATINRHPSSPLNIKVGNATGTTQVKQVEIKSITKPAAGETSTITLALTDANNQPIIGIDNNAVVSIDGAEQLLKITETNNKGTYTATLSGQKSGDHEVIVTIGGVKSTGSTLTVDAPMPIAVNHGGKSGSRGVIDRATLTVSPIKELKSGDTLQLIATLKDAFENSLTGVDLAQSLTHNQKGNVSWVAQQDGTHTANLVLTQVGKDQLFITVNKTSSLTDTIYVKPQSGINAIHKVNIIDITNTAAGAESTFTVALTDAQGNSVKGVQHVDVTINNQKLPNIAVTQQTDVSYIGTLPGQHAGNYDVVITANKISSTPQTLTVTQPDTVTASANGGGTNGQRGVVSRVALSTLQNSKLTSGDLLQLTVELKDRFSNPLKGVSSASIALQHNNKNATLTWTDHNNGSYTATLPSSQLGNNDLKATVNSQESNMVSIDVVSPNQAAQVHQLTLEPIAPSAAGSEQTITLKAVNIYGHGVVLLKDEIKLTLNGALLPLTLTEDSKIKGTYTAKLPAQKTGRYDVNVAIGQKTATQTWVVKAPTTINADKTDGSGTEGNAAVVKTVELQVVAAQGYKSGETVQLTLTLTDAFDNKLTGVESTKIALTHGQTSPVAWVIGKDDTYTADLVLKTLGKDSLVATVNKLESLPVEITVHNNEGKSKVNNVEIVHVVPVAAGSDSTVVFSLTDSNGHPVSNITSLSVTVDQQQPISMQVAQVPTGKYVGTLPGQQSGSHNMVASIPTQNVTSIEKLFDVSKPVPIAAVARDGSGKKGQYKVVNEVLLNVAPTSKHKAGEKVTLTVTLKDAFGNGLKEVSSNSIVTAHQQSGPVIWKDHADGTYTADLLLRKLGSDTLKVTVNNTIQSQDINVEAPQGLSAVSNVELKATNKTLMMGELVELQLTLTDSHGNGVEKVLANDIQLEHNGTLVVNPIWQEKSNGIYTTELPLHKQGKNTFVSRVNNRTNTPLVINVSALTGSANVKTVEFKASINQLAVGSRTELTLTLTDQWNNGVEGVNAADIVINDSHTKKALTGLIWKYQTNGIYTTPTVIPIAGIHSLGATVNQQKSKNVLIEVKPSTDPSRVHNVTLTAIPNVITAGDNVTLSFKVTDVDNNPVIRLNNSDIRTTNIPSKGQIIWKEDDHGLGTYTATTMLSDVKIHTLSAGVGTSTNTTNITVNSPTGKDAVKTITILPIADSNAGQPSSLSISLTDQYNNPVKNVSSSDIKMKINDKEQSIVFMEKNVMNKYIAQLPASKASRYKITVEVNGQSESTNWNVKVPTEIPIASYDKDGLRGSLETLSITYNATKNTVNSAEKVTLKVGLKDKFGNKLTGASSKLKLLTDLQSTSIWKELKDGFYSQELTMNKLHKQPIQVSAGKILSDKIELIVAPAKGVNNVHKTTLETDVGTLEAGKEVTLILALTDSVDNGVIDINNKDIQLTNNGKSTNVKWVSSQNGVYTTKQQLKTVDNYQFKATVNKQPSRIQTVEATYPSGKDRVKNAKITTNLKTFDAGKEVELTLELKDQYGNLVTNVNGADIVLTDSHSAEIIDSRSIAWHEVSTGVYKATLPLTKVGKHTLTATVNKQNANTNEITVKALKGASNVNEIKSTPAVTSMSAGESTTLTLTMLDKYGNEVADIATKDIKFKNTDDTITTKAQWAKSASHDSVYTAQITLEKVKKHTLLVDVNKQVKNIDIEVKPLEGAKNVAKVELNVPAVLSIGTNANLQLNLKDKFGNGVVTVDASNITMELAGTPTQTKWIESNNGNYTSSLLLTKAGVYPVTVKVNGHPYTTTITIENPKGVKNVAHVSMKSSITADGSGKYITKPGQEFQLTFKLTDQYGNGVTELQATDISLMDAKTSTAIPIKTLQENSTQKGEYTTTVALTQTTQYDLTAEVNKVSDTIQVSVIPFSDTGNTVVVQLKLDKSTIKVGEKADFELKIKDRYGNDVFIDTADIKLLDANNISLQVKWNIEKDTFTRRYTGYLKLATPGKHSISASVVPVRSIPKTITVETGAPVFGPGKSELTANRYETDTKKTFATLYLILKDDNGNPITGKNPRLHSNYWNQPKTITEIEPGKYEANFHNDNRSGIAKITLDNSSIGYNDSAQSIQIINYGEMSITRLGDKKNYSIDEQFPHVGYTGAQFQINPSLWTGSDYSWTVDQNWLYIDSTGIVTLNKQPKDSSKAKVTITGKSRGSNIKNMVYTFTLESWYTHNGKGTPKEALKMCQSPNEVMTQENITLLSKEWGKDTAQKFITEQYFWISNWNFSKYMINANGHMGAFINQINNKERLSIICVQEY
ncbi:invasin domain 3-containing protein [Providencia rettgeri]|uniref:invasin domain 3-containing protein n=1 Tax=unclassified Providencia TaxID=2633465 RepID=UPI001BD203C7|nr:MULTISPECIES: invasin domain 3-containing protein [unclassified Providencia]EJD6375748.1 inverse autotransporter beta domain-containing protein [Providencia rettgeri]ELR5116843.1 inverse autotransporter beta domain-containing protein [Providencia rettgeri]HBK4773980.1 inverse autotransporter beta domain-containing protein [Providencia rettgeri]HEF8780226.1 inverse autotransporter beta domain-containing protein [Providencia rettgeri]